jgi:xanthine dehydrogenase accessory factor
MREVAETVQGWREQGIDAAVARVVSWHGFGGRRAGDALAVNAAGGTAGRLIGGRATDDVIAAAAALLESDRPADVVDVALGDTEAVAAGLACGGTARVLVQRVATFPEPVWAALAARQPVAMATTLDGSGATVVVADNDDVAAGRSGAHIVPGGGTEPDRLVEAFVAPPLIAIVGAAELAGALQRQAALLGWDATVADGAGDEGPAARAAAVLGPADALVVLSHDAGVDTPALAAALRGGAGYVGALGSRHTQAGRRERLAARGLSLEELARIHGPVGLDLGARSPEEVALAICAEILAVRRGRAASSLKDGTGPING